MIVFETPVKTLRGVGPSVAVKLRRLGIATVGDLLYHVPTSYEDYRERQLIAKAPLGVPSMFEGTFLESKSRRSWNNRKLTITEGIFQDESGSIAVSWFGRFPIKAAPPGERVRIFGTVEERSGKRQIVNPTIEKLDTKFSFAGKLAPRYALTQGIGQRHMRGYIAQVLFEVRFVEWYDEQFLRTHKLVSLSEAIVGMHAPTSDKEIRAARRRLAFDELFFVALAHRRTRDERQTLTAPQISGDVKDALWQLPVEPTSDQRRAVEEIAEDLQKSHPMTRLLQGDVGSGKTLVAAAVASVVSKAGYQTLYLAPTEVLAEQQYAALSKLFQNFDIRIGLLTRTSSMLDKPTTRAVVLEALENGQVDILIGTHALLQNDVAAKNLGLVVVDEQHRFGVEQRMSLQAKGGIQKKGRSLTPHLLSMTATPIPRTLQLTIAGDVDVSTLKIMPFGERKIKNMLFGDKDRKRVELALARRVQKGEQIYVICPLIDPSDFLGVQSATEEYERLKKTALKSARIGLLHGKMKSEEKTAALNDFRAHKIDVLVSTTVIEVGIDVPNATVLVVEGAERFGLAQLHQLRGRVGRAGQEGVCVLFSNNSKNERLQAFIETNDGFKLAELDLKFRGPGQWLGKAQSGFEDLQVADMNDLSLLEETREAVAEFLHQDSDLKQSPMLKERLETLLETSFHAS